VAAVADTPAPTPGLNVLGAVLAGDLGSVIAPAGENNCWLT